MLTHSIAEATSVGEYAPTVAICSAARPRLPLDAVVHGLETAVNRQIFRKHVTPVQLPRLSDVWTAD